MLQNKFEKPNYWLFFSSHWQSTEIPSQFLEAPRWPRLNHPLVLGRHHSPQHRRHRTWCVVGFRLRLLGQRSSRDWRRETKGRHHLGLLLAVRLRLVGKGFKTRQIPLKYPTYGHLEPTILDNPTYLTTSRRVRKKT